MTLPLRKSAGSEYAGALQSESSMTAFWNNLIDRMKHRESEDFTKMQVIVHDGGPQKTKCRPQLAWVRVTGSEDNLFRGVVLDKPAQLRGVRKGTKISF